MEEYLKRIDLQDVSMQTLAFIGDSVYDLYIRSYLASKSNEKAGLLHNKAISYVSARSQAGIVDKILDSLTQEEVSIYKRGRNAKSATVPKNADVRDYRMATGFEALVGYLHLIGDYERLNYILSKAVTIDISK